MTTRHCDVAIIGGGTAGLHAFKEASSAGADVVIVDRGPPGSTCTRSGCIPSKALIAAGRAAFTARHAGGFGIAVADIAVDGAAVMRRVRAVRDKADGQIADEYLGFPEDRRIHGSARFTGPAALIVDDGAAIKAKSVIIATGASPVMPDFLQPVTSLVHTHETIFEIADLPPTLAVIGAGPLGLELAQAFARLGVAVTVLDKSDTIGAMKDDAAQTAARNALAGDVTFVLGVDIAAEMAGDEAQLSWPGGAIRVAMILAAVGQTPNVKDLDLDRAGIATDDTGVPCFDPVTRRCGDAAIFVAGDVDAWRPVLHEAARGGRVAALGATAGETCPQIPALAIAFTEPNLATIGCAFDALPDGAIIGTGKAADDIRAQIDGDDRGLVRIYADRDGRLIGGSIVLTGGEHLAQTLALAIDRGMSASDFADQAWYHPVLEELLQAATRDVIRQLG